VTHPPGARSTPVPALIALDWGTTSLRAYLLAADGTTVLDRRAEPWGIMRLPEGGFAAAFDRVTGGWRARAPEVGAVAAGMVGSAQGWVEVPYCPAPAGAAELAAALAPAHGGVLHVVPGVARLGDAPDVMRGEETQVVGALALRPDLAERSLLVLPGTHSKWVRVADGAVRDFTTYVTGELFAVLREHSILGRAAAEAGRAPDAAAAAAFAAGVRAARGSAGGVAPLLFSARALVLAGRLAPEASADYLSGLLIGDELRCALAAGEAPRALVGDAALCRRYAAALRLFDVDAPPVIDGAAPAGLWHIARRAGLVAPAAGPRA
jgi:2-dehydro-3-deoxygalactonokinase